MWKTLLMLWLACLALSVALAQENSFAVKRPQPPTAGCPPGRWTKRHNSCYIYTNGSYNWFEAKVACDVMRSHLVEMKTAEENQFVTQFIRQNGGTQTWLGMTDFQEDGIHRWISNNEVPDLTFWKAGEPDINGMMEDCGAMDGEGWFDSKCEASIKGFVCEVATRGPGQPGRPQPRPYPTRSV